MRNKTPSSYRFTFLLPRELARAGAVTPLLDGCSVFGRDDLIGIDAPSRERAFEQAALLLGVAAKEAAPVSIAAVLETPFPSGRDGWSIIIGANVAFSPTTMPAYFPAIDLGPAIPSITN